jgi:hypothetical protein
VCVFSIVQYYVKAYTVCAAATSAAAVASIAWALPACFSSALGASCIKCDVLLLLSKCKHTQNKLITPRHTRFYELIYRQRRQTTRHGVPPKRRNLVFRA